MNDLDKAESHSSSTADAATGGINLLLIYSLIAAALLGAIIIALFIVLPFYHRH
jgi:hypothetical protein